MKGESVNSLCSSVLFLHTHRLNQIFWNWQCG